MLFTPACFLREGGNYRASGVYLPAVRKDCYSSPTQSAAVAAAEFSSGPAARLQHKENRHGTTQFPAGHHPDGTGIVAVQDGTRRPGRLDEGHRNPAKELACTAGGEFQGTRARRTAETVERRMAQATRPGAVP